MVITTCKVTVSIKSQNQGRMHVFVLWVLRAVPFWKGNPLSCHRIGLDMKEFCFSFYLILRHELRSFVFCFSTHPFFIHLTSSPLSSPMDNLGCRIIMWMFDMPFYLFPFISSKPFKPIHFWPHVGTFNALVELGNYV